MYDHHIVFSSSLYDSLIMFDLPQTVAACPLVWKTDEYYREIFGRRLRTTTITDPTERVWISTPVTDEQEPG